MALKLVWTKRAEKGYDDIIKYLEENWSEKEVQNFVKRSEHFMDLLTQHPKILQRTRSRKNVFRGPMDSHNIITYRYKPRKKEIELLNIWSARRKPLKP